MHGNSSVCTQKALRVLCRILSQKVDADCGKTVCLTGASAPNFDAGAGHTGHTLIIYDFFGAQCTFVIFLRISVFFRLGRGGAAPVPIFFGGGRPPPCPPPVQTPLFNSYALDSNTPALVTTPQISTRLSCKHSLTEHMQTIKMAFQTVLLSRKQQYEVYNFITLLVNLLGQPAGVRMLRIKIIPFKLSMAVGSRTSFDDIKFYNLYHNKK